MTSHRATVAISLDHDRLLAVAGQVSGGKLNVKGWVSSQAPAGLELRDAKIVGEWVKAELQKSSIGSGARLAIVVPRGDVVLKKLKLPHPEGGAAELAGMVRLQMARQLTMAIEGTAIDYMPIEGSRSKVEGSEDGAAKGAGGSGMVDVLAGALPADRMQWYRDMADAADCRISRIGLRASGAAALLAGVSHRHNGPVLGVALGWSSIEFIVVRDGQLVFARAADVGIGSVRAGEDGRVGEGDNGLSARIAVEAKRTWMSYRVGDEAASVEAVVVPGGGSIATDAGEACGKALEMPWELADLSGLVEFPEGMSESDQLIAAPLVGLLGEETLAHRSLDFANPRKAPDRAAIRRQQVLAAVLGLIVIGGGGYVYSGIEIDRARSRLVEAQKRTTELRKDYSNYLLDHARLSHIQKWTTAGFDWLAHAGWLSEQMPDPRHAQLDQLGGAAGIKVSLAPNSGRYDINGWQIEQLAKFSLQGKSRQREVANELRDRLVTSPIYQVETKGADMADRFSMELTTQASSPDQAAKSSKPDAGKTARAGGGA